MADCKPALHIGGRPALSDNLLEERIEGEAKSALPDDYPIPQFHAIPLAGAQFIRAFQETNYFPDAVRRVRDWLLQEEASSLWPWYGKQMLKEMCPGIGPVLQEALLELIKSGDEEKHVCAVSSLSVFNEGTQAPDMFYELIEQALLSKPNSRVQRALELAMQSHGIMSSAVYEDRIQMMRQWTSHDDLRVRTFAQQQVRSFERSLEKERKRETVF